MFGRQREKMTRAGLARRELGSGVDHLKRAAGYAMEGVGETMGPRANAIRKGWGSALGGLVALAPVVKGGQRQAERMMKRGKQARKEAARSRRWRKVAGLLAAGAAVGAAGAAVRRRRARQWDEYDPEHAFDVVHPTTGSSAGMVGKASASAGKAMDAASTAVDKGGEKLSSALSAAQDKVSSGTQTTQPPSRNGHS